MGVEGVGTQLPVVGSGKDGSPGFLTTRLDFVVNWARRNSLWPMPFGTACCAIEMMASYASRFDVARFGMERMSFSPRQADLLICAGRVSYKMAPVLRKIWDQMPQPKWSISMGACAFSMCDMRDTFPSRSPNRADPSPPCFLAAARFATRARMDCTRAPSCSISIDDAPIHSTAGMSVLSTITFPSGCRRSRATRSAV